METGFNAMGKPVPANRLQKGYEEVKTILNCDSETAWTISRRIAHYIEKDRCAFVIGYISLADVIKGELLHENKAQTKSRADEKIAKIDLTGRYRVLATMLT